MDAVALSVSRDALVYASTAPVVTDATVGRTAHFA
jgi:hypothetical protein